MKLFATALFSVICVALAFRPTPKLCPSKCYFPLSTSLPPSETDVKIPCPFNCNFYACKKTFGPNLPAFGIGITCADQGLATAPPPEELPEGTVRSCFREGTPIKDLPYLPTMLPDAPIPKCPRACVCVVGKRKIARRCGSSLIRQPLRKCRKRGKKGKKCCSLPLLFGN